MPEHIRLFVTTQGPKSPHPFLFTSSLFNQKEEHLWLQFSKKFPSSSYFFRFDTNPLNIVNNSNWLTNRGFSYTFPNKSKQFRSNMLTVIFQFYPLLHDLSLHFIILNFIFQILSWRKIPLSEEDFPIKWAIYIFLIGVSNPAWWNKHLETPSGHECLFKNIKSLKVELFAGLTELKEWETLQ